MDVLFWLKVGGFWLIAGAVVMWILGRCKMPETPTETRVRLADDWRAAIRRDVRAQGLRQASRLKVVK